MAFNVCSSDATCASVMAPPVLVGRVVVTPLLLGEPAIEVVLAGSVTETLADGTLADGTVVDDTGACVVEAVEATTVVDAPDGRPAPHEASIGATTSTEASATERQRVDMSGRDTMSDTEGCAVAEECEASL